MKNNESDSGQPQVGSDAVLGGLVFAGCMNHRHRADISCCKIRRRDGTPLTVGETWAEIKRLREIGDRMAAMLDLAPTAPVEQWPNDDEITAVVTEWRSEPNETSSSTGAKE